MSHTAGPCPHQKDSTDCALCASDRQIAFMRHNRNQKGNHYGTMDVCAECHQQREAYEAELKWQHQAAIVKAKGKES